MGDAEGPSSSGQATTAPAQAAQSLQEASTSESSGQTQSSEKQGQHPAEPKKKKKWEPLQVPSPMQIMQEDAMNNCLVKGTISCIMGGIAGFAFGLFSASIENAGVSVSLQGCDHMPSAWRLKHHLFHALPAAHRDIDA